MADAVIPQIKNPSWAERLNRKCRGAKPRCRGFGGVPQLFSSPPRLGEPEGVDVDYLINLIMCCGEGVERKKQRYPN